VVALHPQPPGRGADAADDQRAADRQLQVVAEHGWDALLGQRGRDHLAPRRPGVDDDPIVLDTVDGPEPSQVGHDAVADLPAAEHRVPLPLGRNGVPLRGGPADCGGHVLVRRGEQDASRYAVDNVPEVLGRGGSRPMVDAELPSQWRR
jgi:hypothetical protein